MDRADRHRPVQVRRVEAAASTSNFSATRLRVALEPMDGLTGGKKAEVEKLRFMVIPTKPLRRPRCSARHRLLTDIGVASSAI
jgi:hypothetical protein